jgi:signal transduction histidine kinase
MVTTAIHRRLFLLWQLTALAMLAALGLVDVYTGLLTSPVLPVGAVRVLAAVATAAVWLNRHGQGSGRLPRLAVALGALSIALTVVVLLLGGDAGSWGLAETLGLLGVLYVVSRRGAAPWAVVAVGVVGAAVSLLPLRSGTGNVSVIFSLFSALCAAAVIAAGTYLRVVESTRRRALDTVRAEQRAEFARDLHDFIAHHVTGIVVQAQGARYVAEQDPQRVILALERIEQAGAETMASMRRMVGVLRDPDAPPDAPLAPLAGVADLGGLLDGFNDSGGPVCRLHVDGELGGLPVEISTSAYRVVMEALTNIRQHASAARAVDVWVRRTPDWLLIRVANDGAVARGAGARDRHGYGLVGLTERVRAVGGRITAGPGAGTGWVVDAALPLDREVAR